MKKIFILLGVVFLLGCDNNFPGTEEEEDENDTFLTDAESVDMAFDALTFIVISGENDSEDSITAFLELPTEGAEGTTVSWSSDKETVIAVDVTVTPSQIQDEVVNLTATISKNEASRTKIFTLTVKKYISDAEAVASAEESLTFDSIKNENQLATEIWLDLFLPTAGENETVISWASSKPSVVGVTGPVSRPAGADEDVVLTATISKNEASGTKDFQLTVLQSYTIYWGNVHWPESYTAEAGIITDYFYGRVYVDGVTTRDSDQPGPGITAQLGYGPPGSDPSAAAGWTWVDAVYNSAFTSPADDEYMATLTVSVPGTYDYAYRYSGDSGATWTYCGTDGVPYNTPGVLTVNP